MQNQKLGRLFLKQILGPKLYAKFGVLRMLMHLSSSQWFCYDENFNRLNFYPIGLTAPGELTLGFALNF